MNCHELNVYSLNWGTCAIDLYDKGLTRVRQVGPDWEANFGGGRCHFYSGKMSLLLYIKWNFFVFVLCISLLEEASFFYLTVALSALVTLLLLIVSRWSSCGVFLVFLWKNVVEVCWCSADIFGTFRTIILFLAHGVFGITLVYHVEKPGWNKLCNFKLDESLFFFIYFPKGCIM